MKAEDQLNSAESDHRARRCTQNCICKTGIVGSYQLHYVKGEMVSETTQDVDCSADMLGHCLTQKKRKILCDRAITRKCLPLRCEASPPTPWSPAPHGSDEGSTHQLVLALSSSSTKGYVGLGGILA